MNIYIFLKERPLIQSPFTSKTVVYPDPEAAVGNALHLRPAREVAVKTPNDEAEVPARRMPGKRRENVGGPRLSIQKGQNQYVNEHPLP